MMLKSLFNLTDNKLHSHSDCIIDKSELAVPVLHRLITENVFIRVRTSIQDIHRAGTAIHLRCYRFLGTSNRSTKTQECSLS